MTEENAPLSDCCFADINEPNEDGVGRCLACMEMASLVFGEITIILAHPPCEVVSL